MLEAHTVALKKTFATGALEARTVDSFPNSCFCLASPCSSAFSTGQGGRLSLAPGLHHPILFHLGIKGAAFIQHLSVALRERF